MAGQQTVAPNSKEQVAGVCRPEERALTAHIMSPQAKHGTAADAIPAGRPQLWRRRIFCALPCSGATRSIFKTMWLISFETCMQCSMLSESGRLTLAA